MKFEIEKPLEFILECSYINGLLNGKEIPEMENLNNLVNNVRKKILEGLKNESN